LGELLFQRMLEKGLVTELESRKNLQNSVIVLHPPLITSKENVDEALRLIDDAMTECLRKV